jgi:hypothetical protein
MSLNRSEQRVYDYLQTHADERHHWQDKVQKAMATSADEHAAALQLAGELWRYQVERSEVVPVFREAAQREGLQRTSMKNLAEFLIRLWTAPRPRKPLAGRVAGL